MRSSSLSFEVQFGILRVLHIGGTQSRGSISQLTPSLVLVSESTILLFTVIAALVMARIEHRRFWDYGFRSGGVLGRNFGSGCLWAFIVISVTLFAIFTMHGFHVTGSGIRRPAILASTVVWSVTFLLVGMSEEFAFRGYPQFTLASGIGFWPAAFILSALFGLVHQGNKGESVFGFMSVVFFGLLFCFACFYDAQAICGSRLGSTPVGIGASPSSMAFLTAGCFRRTACSNRCSAAQYG